MPGSRLGSGCILGEGTLVPPGTVIPAGSVLVGRGRMAGDENGRDEHGSGQICGLRDRLSAMHSETAWKASATGTGKPEQGAVEHILGPDRVAGHEPGLSHGDFPFGAAVVVRRQVGRASQQRGSGRVAASTRRRPT